MRKWIGSIARKVRLVRDHSSDMARYQNYSLLPGEAKLFINIGAGHFYHPRWTNVDYASDWYSGHQQAKFVNYNIMEMKPLPFSDDSVYLAYTSHTIEHVTTEAALNLFSEVRRTLVPGGIFRITCPDADILCNAVASGRIEYWTWRTQWFRDHGADVQTLTPGDYLVREIATSRSRHVDIEGQKVDAADAEKMFFAMEREAFLDWLVAPCAFREEQPGLHMNWWTIDKCRELLRRAGFRQIYRSTHGGSLAAPLQNKLYFDNTRPEMSLYVDAVRD